MVTRVEIVNALKLAEAAGCRFSVTYHAPSGGMQSSISPDDIADIILDRINLPARVTGLSPSEYSDWVELDGRVRCAALTKAKRRCKKTVAGHFREDPLGWKALNDSSPYCEVHGGD